MFWPSSDCGDSERAVSGGLAAGGAAAPGTTHQLGVLGAHGVGILQQRLELIVLGESDDLQDGAELGKDLQEEGGRVGLASAREPAPTRRPALPCHTPPHLVKHVQGHR